MQVCLAPDGLSMAPSTVDRHDEGDKALCVPHSTIHSLLPVKAPSALRRHDVGDLLRASNTCRV